jgi:AcrR family transcriptional regulator
MRRRKSTVRQRTGRPTQAQSAELEERLRHAAVDVFLKKGFEGAAMEAIARAAGITKRTLYARYADKNALFGDAMVWAMARYHSPELPKEIEEWDLAAGLMEVARSTLARARDPDVVRLNRLAMIEAAHIPDFSNQAYSTIWSPRVVAVINLLAAHKKAGTIEVAEIEMAAEHFLAMVAQFPIWLAAMGQSRPPEMEERYARYAVELFLRSIQPLRATTRRVTVKR